MSGKPSANSASGFNSRAIHLQVGEPDEHMGLYQRSDLTPRTTYEQNGLADLRGGFEYGRVANPTVRSLEHTLAALEEAKYARVFASGMAATDALIRILVRPGDHVILGNDAYGGTYRLLNNDYGEWAWSCPLWTPLTWMRSQRQFAQIPRLFGLETPTNPALTVTDIEGVVAIKQHAQVVVDSTFATPYLQNPLALGADYVLHSTTKYLGGHSDVLGGAVVTNDEHVDERLLYFQGCVGAVSSPFDAYLTARGIKTLAVRMERHCTNAQAVAEYLQSRPEVKQVLYPGFAGLILDMSWRRSRCVASAA